MKRSADLFFALSLILLSTGTAFAAEWRTVDVPGKVEFTGHAWFRTWVKPHASYFSKHERDLWGESTLIGIKGVPGAHEVFVNSVKLGTAGGFPPEYKDGRDGNFRHKIPPGTLVKDQWNEIAFRMYNPAGPGGFVAEAPFMMNYFWEVEFTGKWEFRSGDDPAFAGKTLKDRPKTSSFDKFHESSRILGATANFITGEKLSPAESFAKMRPNKDFEVDLMVAEPLVAQPTYFSFDERGRLWVAQYRQYPYPAGIKMLSRDKYYRSHYDRIPPAPPNHDRGRDIISIHEDTDGDGAYDKHKVFQDGLNMANSAIRGRDGVWVMNTPYLLFYPDRDFDDVPDGDPVVHLTGFGLEDSHSVANGLVWGADGWLYGAQGSTTTCRIRRPGIDSPKSKGVYFQGCMVWRYHPESRRFELFSEGGGNNFGLEIDDNGRLYTGHNGGTTRGFHYVQGGYYLMQGKTPNKYGPPRNPFSFGELPKMGTEQPVPRFTHFAALGEGTAIPKKYAHSFFSVDPLHNFVIASRRLDAGSTFTTTDLAKVLECDDFAFRPVYIGNAPDGSMFIADFYEHYIAHGQHYQSQIDPTTGRIFRLRGKGMKLEADLNLADKSSSELIELLGHANKWHRHTAVRLLGERKDRSVRGPLRKLIGTGRGFAARCALWAYYQAFELDQGTGIAALKSSDAAVRYWTVRFLTDDIGFANKRTTVGLIDSLGDAPGSKRLAKGLHTALLEQARYESSAEVRSQMAASARRLPTDQALPLVKAVLAHEEDLADAYVPLMCWWVFDAKADTDRSSLMALFDDREFWDFPMVREHILPRIMQRLASQSRNRDLLDCARLLGLAPSKEHTAQLLKGFEEGFKGRPMDGLPEVLTKALLNSGMSSLILNLRLRNPAAIKTAVSLVGTSKTKLQERLAVIRTLGELKVPSARTTLLIAALDDTNQTIQKAALAALSFYAEADIGQRVIGRLAKLDRAVQPAAFDLLLSRQQWTGGLLGAVKRGEIDRSIVSGEVIQRLKQSGDENTQLQAEEIFTATPEPTSDFNHQIASVEKILKGGPGNPYAGEAAFMTRCAACHKLFHKGGSIGPDLTPYQRGDLNTMLISVVNPNAEIREGFEYVSLETTDGRSLSGFLTDQDNQIVALRGMAGEDIRVSRADVKSLKPMGRSLMPEGLLQQLTDQEMRDFFAYLRISQPISR